MAPFVLAWLVAEGIITYRGYKQFHGPPGPGQLLYSSLLFVALGILAESPKARPIAATFAWGMVAAAFLNIASFGTPKPTGTQWPPKPAANYQIIPDGHPTGPDPVGGHATEANPTGGGSGATSSTGQGTATGPGRPGIG